MEFRFVLCRSGRYQEDTLLLAYHQSSSARLHSTSSFKASVCLLSARAKVNHKANPKIKKAQKNTLPTAEMGKKWILMETKSKLSYSRCLFQKLVFFLKNSPKQPLSQALLAPCWPDKRRGFTTSELWSAAKHVVGGSRCRKSWKFSVQVL